MSDTRPIGVFDSGLGGLTVVRELQRVMPGEKIVYLGDTARFPYGGRSEEVIGEFAHQAGSFLYKHDIKLMIVACNTASSVGLDSLKRHTREHPVIGVVLPGARASVLRTAEKKIGVIGTRATVRSEAYNRAILKLDSEIRVYGKPCPLFAPLVEEGLLDSEITRMTAQHYLYELVDKGIDCLILGCTHYPLLMEVIQATVGTRVQLIDTALWTAKEAQDILVALDSLNDGGDDGLAGSSFFVTDLTPGFRERAEAFLGAELTSVKRVTIEELTDAAGD